MKRALFALGLVLAIGVGAFAISHNRDTKVPVNPAPSITPPATEANPTMVSAADEIAQTLSALNNYGAISGRYESLDESGVFVLSNNGSYRIEHGKLLETFFADTKAKRRVDSTNTPAIVTEQTNSPGGTERIGPISRLTSFVRSLHADTTNIADATYDGQPAWLLSSDALLITVDKVASFPVSVEVRDGGKTTMRLSIHDLAVNPPTSSADFVAKIPTDATVSSEDSRYIETDIDKAPALAGYAVPQPKVVPDGYTVHSAWFNASAVSGAETFTNQVRVTYRKGLSSFVVEIARLGATKQRDPWMGDTTPHRFVSADGLVAVVGGDLTAAELVDVANSLSL